MRKNPTHGIEKHRITTGVLKSSKQDNANGAFLIPGPNGILTVICSDGRNWKAEGMPGTPWEHVSVSTGHRCPTWDEMDFVKRIFWRDDETVMQFHVPRDQHINRHEFCLHLWRPIGIAIELPPLIAV